VQACIYEEYGPPEVVRVAQVEAPVARAGELLVRVHASAVTSADWRFRSSSFPGPFWLPGRLLLGLLRPRHGVLGMDFSGVVAAVGTGVTEFRAGDAVFGSASFPRCGAHAEYLTVPDSAVIVRKPASLSHVQAAAIPFGANAAWLFLRNFARVRAGQRVLILGASGAVGSWAVQLARHLGAHVTGVCSAHNADLVRSLGAEQVLDYSREPLPRAGESFDLILDTVGATHFAACRSLLAEHGTYLPLENGLRELGQALLGALRGPLLGGPRVRLGISHNSRAALRSILALIEAGAVQPVVDRVYPMAEVAQAHRHVESRHKRGSVVLQMQPG
jgi:NADPH:quinone reductase-like Zn-dependent oxidoreductase